MNSVFSLVVRSGDPLPHSFVPCERGGVMLAIPIGAAQQRDLEEEAFVAGMHSGLFWVATHRIADLLLARWGYRKHAKNASLKMDLEGSLKISRRRQISH